MAESHPVVLITGCSTGIGRALVKACADAGYRVAATARQTASIQDLVTDRVLGLRLDVTDQSSIDAAVQRIHAEFGTIDIAVNNAGYGLMGPVAELEIRQFRRQLETNLLGAVAVCQAVLPGMIKQRRGRLVMMGSVSGILTTPFSGAYCASKAAVHAVADALRMETAPFGIQVITVQPGAIESRFGDSAKQTLPEEPAAESAYAAYRSGIEARAVASKHRATPVDVFAAKLVKKLGAKRPPQIIRGGRGAWVLPLVRRFPIRLRDFILRRRFGL